MSQERLLISAAKLQAVSKQASKEYFDKKELLISIINEQMLKREDIKDLVGEKNLALMKDNHNNHVLFMHSIFENLNTAVFLETVLWVFRTYLSRGFHQNYWSAFLNTWIQTLKQNLSPQSFSEIFPYYEWMLVNVPLFIKQNEQKSS